MKRIFLLLFLVFMCRLPADGIIVCEHSMQTVEWMHQLVQVAEQSIEISMPYGGGRLFREFLSHSRTSNAGKEPIKGPFSDPSLLYAG